MKYATIQRPSEGTLQIMRRKAFDPTLRKKLEEHVEAVGICQGSVMEILVASDVAEKAAGVASGEINGSCPQHMTCLIVVGDTGSVRAAMEAVKESMQTL